jgi:hypothetical protein
MVKAIPNKVYSELELRTLQDGGYLVTHPRRESHGGYYQEPFIAAFTTLEEALKWIGAHLTKNEHSFKRAV